MRFLRQSLVGILLVSLTLALLIWAGQIVSSAIQTRMAADNSAPAARERVFTVTVQTAKVGPEIPILQAFGQIASRRTLELRAAVGGRVVELADNFDEGGIVETGEVLVRIDPADAQAAMDRAESDMLDAHAEGRDAERALTLARDELTAAEAQAELRARAAQRQADLQERGVGTAAAGETAELALASSRQAVLARRLAVASAEARVDQAATKLARAGIALEEARRKLADTTLTAGFDGTLSEVSLVEGRLVTVNEKLAQLVDPNDLEVAFRVSTAQYSRLLDEAGELIPAQVVVSLGATGTNLTATGRITRDAAVAGDGQSGRLIFAALGAAPGFKPGDFVTVAIEEPVLENVARLPSSALDAFGTVLVLGPEDRLETMQVQLLRRQGDDILVRADGLQGLEVVVGRTPLLGEGIRVRPLRPSDRGADERAMLELSDEHRARLVALVEGNERMPPEAKAKALTALTGAKVPARLVERLEARAGG